MNALHRGATLEATVQATVEATGGATRGAPPLEPTSKPDQEEALHLAARFASPSLAEVADYVVSPVDGRGPMLSPTHFTRFFQTTAG